MRVMPIMAFVVALFLCFALGPCALGELGGDAILSQDAFQKQIAAEMLQLVNKERAAAGLAPVSGGYERLNQAAQLRAAELPRAFSHTRPDGSECWTVFQEFDIPKTHGKGENVGGGYQSPQDVMKTWMKSKKGHNENILSPEVNYLGVGYVYEESSKYKHFWILLFVGVDQSLEIALAETDGTYTQLACHSNPPVDAWTPEWESDNPSVATIAPDGVVTVHQPGVANITATITSCYTASVTTSITVLESAFENEESAAPGGENPSGEDVAAEAPM